jgi:hypothetical protein
MGDAWEPIGAALSANAGNVSISGLSMAIGAGNKPILAWREMMSGSIEPLNIYVQRWTGSSWEPLGTAVSANGGNTSAGAPGLALEAGRPVIAWAEPASEEAYSSNNPYVWRWDGTSWQSVGALLRGAPGETSNLVEVQIGVGPLGRILAVWGEYEKPITTDSSSSIYAYQWEEGQGWRALGEALSAIPERKSARVPSLALQHDGNPVIAWEEKDLLGTANVYVSRWVGNGWQLLDGALSALPGRTDARAPVVRVDSDGYPLVMWTEFIEGSIANAVFVYRYNR